MEEKNQVFKNKKSNAASIGWSSKPSRISRS
jgi:hypothetical protein